MVRPGILEGVTVLDLSRLLPGPLASSVLADNGARVIEVDARVSSGEAVSRATLPSLHRKKESISLNVRTPRGHELFLELVKRADVVIESFRPQSARGIGVDYETARKVNPRIIFCSITGYGQTGPMSSMAGHDINYIASNGLADMLAPEGVSLSVPGIQLADVFGGSMQAVIGILLALMWRDKSGDGQHLDINMTEGAKALATLPFDFMRLGMPHRCGESVVGGGLGCYGFYRAADGAYLAVGALENKYFSRLCGALGVPELVPMHYDPDMQDQVRSRLQSVFSTKTAEQWDRELQAMDVCVTRVKKLEEATGQGSVTSCEVPETVSGAGVPGSFRFGQPVRLCDSPDVSPQRTAPPGGQTDAILRELGLGSEEIGILRRDGVV
jgi:crotonobetainyl-CoA:carnitine CoA-transferase CaiB-like acyl-CoA transferase